MLDCGMHMGYKDARKYPDFSFIASSNTIENTSVNFTESIHAVIISHFHLDHCGALPYFTERSTPHNNLNMVILLLRLRTGHPMEEGAGGVSISPI